MGGFLYADDLSLIAPSHAILARMLEMVAENGASLNLHFSTLVKNLRTNGVTLLWKESAVHHGHTLQQNLNFDADAATRRAGFISRSVEVREQFSSASPAHVLKAVRILCCHGYGAVLWRIDSSSASSFFKAYNRCVKRVFRLPLNTFTYLVEGHHHSLQPGIPEKPDDPRLWHCLSDNDLGAL